MKKGILLLISILFFGISAGAQGQVPVSGVDIDEPTLDLHPGDESTLTAILNPISPDDPSVIWTSSDSATVDITSTGSGLVCNLKAMKTGTATIKVKTADGGYEASCVVTVTDPILVTNVTILKDNSVVIDTIKVEIGDAPVSLSAEITPPNATNKEVEWGAQANGVLTVSNNGTVTFLTAGNAKVHVTAKGGENVSDTCVFVVKPKLAEDISISGDKNRKLVKGAELQLSATVTPSSASNKEVEWSHEVSNTVAEVSNTGKVKALTAGDTYIVAKTKDGTDLTDTCYIKVTDSVHVNSIELSKDTLRMTIGDEENLTAEVKPDNATEKGVKWSVTNNSATIDNGKVTAIKAISKMYVIAETKDGGLKDTCVLIINNKDVTAIKLDKDTVRFAVGDSVLLKATITPTNATDQSVTWEPKDSKIATVKDGLVKAVAVGETSIFVTSNSNDKVKDTCIVIVSAQVFPVDSVKLNKDSISIIKGDTISLIASIFPANATNKKVTWASESNTIATVDANGLVTAKSVGKTKVIVTTENGSKRDTCIVTVREKVILIEPVVTAQGDKGSIPLMLNVPDKETLTGVFTIKFPDGVELDEENTKLTEAFAASSSLSFTKLGNYTWKIEIKKKDLKSMLLALKDQKIMDIAYTITKNVKKGDLLDVNIKDAAFKFTDNTEIKEESMTFKLKADFTTSNNIIDGEKAYAYTVDNRLYIQSAKAETIYVYSLNGTLLYSGEKAEGKITVDLNIQEPIIIVKGSSGWVQKVAK